MQNSFEIHLATRKNILNLLDGLTLEQLNKVPDGFNNNILWNAAHCVVTQQLLCYKLSGNAMNLSDQLVDENRKGSKPEKPFTEDELKFWKEQLISSHEKIVADYNNGIFTEFNEYPTSYNVVLKNVDMAIEFNNTHEGLHLGYMMAIRKSL